MTAAALDPIRTLGLPRRAIAVSVALHAAALLFLPGLAREAGRLELPPLIASLRALPAVQPAAAAPSPATAAGAARALPRQFLPRPARNEESAAPPAAAASRSEAPAAPQSAAPGPEMARPEPGLPAPTPALLSAPAPATAAVEKLALDDYGRALSELLARQQQYPRLAALRGWEGEVRLRLKVARKGALVAVQVVHSSGHEVLDQHALQLVQATALPNPPDNLGDREIQVVVPIHYKLQRPT